MPFDITKSNKGPGLFGCEEAGETGSKSGLLVLQYSEDGLQPSKRYITAESLV